MVTIVLDHDLCPCEDDQFTSPIRAFNPPNLNDLMDVLFPLHPLLGSKSKYIVVDIKGNAW